MCPDSPHTRVLLLDGLFDGGSLACKTGVTRPLGNLSWAHFTSACPTHDGAIAEALGLPLEEVHQMLEPSKQWPFHARETFWWQERDAMRHAVERLGEAVTQTKALVDAGAPLSDWQAAALRLVLADLVRAWDALQDLHDANPPPWLPACPAPPHCLVADRPALGLLLSALEECGSDLRPTLTAAEARPALAELDAALQRSRLLLLGQLGREQVVGSLLTRRHCSAQQAAAAERRLARLAAPEDLAFVMRPLDEPARRALAKRLGQGWLAQRVHLRPALERDEAAVGAALRRLCGGGGGGGARSEPCQAVAVSLPPYRPASAPASVNASVKGGGGGGSIKGGAGVGGLMSSTAAEEAKCTLDRSSAVSGFGDLCGCRDCGPFSRKGRSESDKETPSPSPSTALLPTQVAADAAWAAAFAVGSRGRSKAHKRGALLPAWGCALSGALRC
ncbi:hypothetical protein HYH03_007319 [Edaphochlamys debaryana]|uniref:Uncharacterized protein n=1 Tax=Edaphochlamys debaryana TaxID=47281 RepID=A0A835Y0U5_9CHLO|nr:hypothetical protein HYH03_007319 [Edaphochlamys debaryana]|eukprot:KAG2494552.1 hypothetical protein HYH03_007319 [Edaphochlamys debaryana]